MRKVVSFTALLVLAVPVVSGDNTLPAPKAAEAVVEVPRGGARVAAQQNRVVADRTIAVGAGPDGEGQGPPRAERTPRRVFQAEEGECRLN